MRAIAQNFAIGFMSVLLTGCSGYIDRSTDPNFHFGKVYHQCFALKQDGFVIHYKDVYGRDEEEYPYVLQPPAGDDPYSPMPKSVEEYNSKPKQYWSDSGGQKSAIEAVITKGTHLRIDHLIQETLESGTSLPFATILDGPYAGKTMSVYGLLFDPDWPKASERDWSIRPQYLQPCEDEKK
jgi:hypothetical protein